MSISRWRRHEHLHFTLILSVLSLILSTVQLASCQPSQAPTLHWAGPSKSINRPQYANHHLGHRHTQIAHNSPDTVSNNINNNIPLVNDQSFQQVAQNLPLTRQHPSQIDLDNVIESTTSVASLQQQFSFDAQLAPSARLVADDSVAHGCQLPLTWAGRWYQSNKEPIRITNTEISDKGLCRDKKGDKFLFEYTGNTRNQPSHNNNNSPCLVCLVINERHLNVLQYKESSCQPINPNNINQTTNSLIIDEEHSLLDTVCSDIPGDAQLESLFRLDTPAIECPINGQFSFTYDGCRDPLSSLDTCIDKKQLNFKFNACPDVPGSESKSEVFKCYADWVEGNNYYMIGRLEHASNYQDKGKFRCFVYEKSQDGRSIQVAQSLEESCYGLVNANDGPKLLRLTVKPPTPQKCHFPSYIQSQSENWLSVDNSLIYMFNSNSSKYQVREANEGNVIEEATCLQQIHPPAAAAQVQPPQQQFMHPLARNNQLHQAVTSRRHSLSTSNYQQADQSISQLTTRSTSTEPAYLVQITKNCQITNYCVRFYRRTSGIVQIDYFASSPSSDNPCRDAFIGPAQTQIITSTNLEHQRCPLEGAYTIEAPIETDLSYNPSNIFICPRQSYITAQCDQPTRIKIHSRCSATKSFVKNLNCLGSWTTNGLVRLLLADDERKRYSAWFRDYRLTAQDGAPADPVAQPLAWQHQVSTTRSQQLNQLAAGNQMLNSLAPIVDLQIAFLPPLPGVAKPMQVRLTRRNQCSDLRGYAAGSQAASMPGSYQSAASSLVPGPLWFHLLAPLLVALMMIAPSVKSAISGGPPR